MLTRVRALGAVLLAAIASGCDSGVEPQERLLPLVPVTVSAPAADNEPLTIAFDIWATCHERPSLVVRVERRIGELGIRATTDAPDRGTDGCVSIANWYIRDTVRLVPYWSPDSVVVRFALPGPTDSLRVLHRPAAP